jgi:simple sugar transport system ATP-binding protein
VSLATPDTARSVLNLEAVTRDFGAVRALDEVDLELAAGETLGLVGDNGAGKSTLIKIVAGVCPPTRGRVLLEGRPASLTSPREARRHGVEVVFQDLALCENLSATANIFLGREARRRVGPFSWLDGAAMERRARELFAALESDAAPAALVRDLSGGQRQAVAVARTRLSEPRLVLLDEPTAAISVRQVPQVLELIRSLARQGIAVVLVSHRIPDVFAVCDRIAVLRRGRKVAERRTAETTPEEITGLITGAIEG